MDVVLVGEPALEDSELPTGTLCVDRCTAYGTHAC